MKIHSEGVKTSKAKQLGISPWEECKHSCTLYIHCGRKLSL